MNLSDIPSLRLKNLQIIDPKFKRPEALLRYLGPVQSQDFAGAKWALGLRLPGSTDHEVEKAFNEGKILRTHALRPTWHFVSTEDIHWIIRLNAPQVKRIMNYYNKKLELDDLVFKRSQAIITKALKGKNFQTRPQISKSLAENGIKGSVQYLAHI